MYEEYPVKCPHCGEKGLPKVWLGTMPPHCNSCGKAAPDNEVEFIC